MKKIVSILLLTFILINSSAQSSFLAEQKKYERVRTSIAEKEKLITKSLEEKNIELDEINITIVVYKAESIIEIFVRKETEQTCKNLQLMIFALNPGN